MDQISAFLLLTGLLLHLHSLLLLRLFRRTSPHKFLQRYHAVIGYIAALQDFYCISIPNVFLFHGYLSRYGLEQWARDRYGALSAKAGACVECGQCEERCPYHLPIRDMLKTAAKDFGE